MLFKSLGRRTFSSDRLVAVLLDFKEGKLNSSYENLFSAAKKLSKEFSVIISASCANESVIKGDRKVLFKDFPGEVNKIILDCGGETAENLAQKFDLTKKTNSLKFTHLITVHDSFGKDCLPRIAAKIPKSVLISDVISIEKDENTLNLLFDRPIYAGNAIAKVESMAKDSPHLISIRSTAFPPEISTSKIKPELYSNTNIEVLRSDPDLDLDLNSNKLGGTRVLKREIIKSGRPELGASAKIVVSGGRALKSGENFEKLIYPLADVLGAAVGASRAAVDAGYVGNDLQVGQTGKIVAPQLYIAIGISGAIQHVAGMKDSKVIVAINKDSECPIFQVADYGLVGDLFTIIPELTEKLKQIKTIK